jgi:hypothetical protein
MRALQKGELARGQNVYESHQAYQAICHEDKITLGCGAVSDDGVHPPHLERASQKVQIGVRGKQHVVHDVGLEVAHNEIHSHEIVAALPGDDDVRDALARRDEFVVARLHEARVLGYYSRDVSATRGHVALYPPGQAHVIITARGGSFNSLSPTENLVSDKSRVSSYSTF